MPAGCWQQGGRLLRSEMGCGTARPILRWSSSGKLHPHRLAEDTANGVGIPVLFDMPEFSLAADDGIEVTVAEFGLNRGFARLAGHGFLHLDRRGRLSLRSGREVKLSGSSFCPLFPREQVFGWGLGSASSARSSLNHIVGSRRGNARQLEPGPGKKV